MVNHLQIVAYITLIPITFPANTMVLYTAILTIVSFGPIETKEPFVKFFKFRLFQGVEEDSSRMLQQDESEEEEDEDEEDWKNIATCMVVNGGVALDKFSQLFILM